MYLRTRFGEGKMALVGTMLRAAAGLAGGRRLEREMIRERTRCGIAAARRRGARIGRPQDRVDLPRAMYRDQHVRQIGDFKSMVFRHHLGHSRNFFERPVLQSREFAHIWSVARILL